MVAICKLYVWPPTFASQPDTSADSNM
jgi:hypothetical protein